MDDENELEEEGMIEEKEAEEEIDRGSNSVQR